MTDSIAIFPPGQRMVDADGAVISGAVLTFFAAGTTTPRTVYSDSGLSVSLGTSVTCDSGGYPTSDGNAKVQIWTGTTPYKVVCKDASAATVWSQDNIAGALNTVPFAAATFAKPDTDCAADTADTTLTTAEIGTVRNGNPTGGTFTYTLPSAITATNGRGYTFRHVGTANSIIVATVSAQTIDGATTKTISGRYESITIVSDGANWHIEQDANRTVVGGSITPQGRLTLTSGTPILAADVSAGTAVYYTPFVGSLVPIYDGTRYVNYEFSELTLTLASQHALSTLYDVFVFIDTGAVVIGTGPAWTSTSARGTGAGTTQLSRVKGLLTNTVSMTARNSTTTYPVAASRATYLGTIFIDGTAGQCTCHVTWGQSRKWGVWNAFNRRLIRLRVGDSTASWTYASTWRAARAQAANSLSVLCGLAEEWVAVRYTQRQTLPTSSNSGVSQTGIGWNSTSSPSGIVGNNGLLNNVASTVSITGSPVAQYQAAPSLGVVAVAALEQTESGLTGTFNGTEASMLLVAEWEG